MLTLNSVEVEDTFAEAFPMSATRVLVVEGVRADLEAWADERPRTVQCLERESAAVVRLLDGGSARKQSAKLFSGDGQDKQIAKYERHLHSLLTSTLHEPKRLQARRVGGTGRTVGSRGRECFDRLGGKLSDGFVFAISGLCGVVACCVLCANARIYMTTPLQRVECGKTSCVRLLLCQSLPFQRR